MLQIKTIRGGCCKPLIHINDLRGFKMAQAEKSNLSGFISTYSISDEKWGSLVDLLGLYSDKLKKGEAFSGRDIEDGLHEILQFQRGDGTSFDVLKTFLQAAYNDNVYPEVAEQIKESDIPDLF